MGCYALTLETPDPMAKVRQVAHEELNRWLDQPAPLFDREKPPTLVELSQYFTQTRTTLPGGVLQSISQSLYVHFLDQKQCACPQCDTLLNRKRMEPKHYNTLQGPGRLERPYYCCRHCKIGCHPLDEALELTRAFHQYDIEEKVLKLATEMPYERAAELVTDLTGVPVSNHHGHETLIDVAQIADLETVIPDSEEIARRIEQAKKTPDDKPVLVVAVDGAHAPPKITQLKTRAGEAARGKRRPSLPGTRRGAHHQDRQLAPDPRRRGHAAGSSDSRPVRMLKKKSIS